MAIDINKSTDAIEMPGFRLVGQRVFNTSFEVTTSPGTYGGANDTIDINVTEDTVTDETAGSFTVYKISPEVELADIPIIFRGDVTVTIDAIQTGANVDVALNSYSNREATDFVGATAVTDNKVGKKAEVYYTTNGKTPMRTKSNLYTGAFTIRRNLSGTDNTIIKARTYCHGKWSKVMKVEFSIIKEDAKRV